MRLIRYQASLVKRVGFVTILGVLLSPLLLVALVAGVLLLAYPERPVADIFADTQTVKQMPRLLLLYALAVALYVVPFVQLRYEAVTIDEDGIRYSFTPPRPFARFSRVWRVGWDEIQAARIDFQFGNRPMLRLDTPLGMRSLALAEWADAAQPTRLRFKLFKPRFDQHMAFVQQSALWQALTARGIAIAVPDRARAIEADLFANRYTLVAVMAVFALGIYGFTDFIFVEEAYVAGYPKVAVFGLGAAVALLSTLVLWRQKIKATQAVGVGAMLGLAFGFAAVPGLLRVNALTDTTGPTPHTYILQAHTRLVSHEPNAPTVIFKHDRDYWSLFAVGSEHRLYLRRGGLGFQQVHLTPLYADMRRRLGPRCRR